MATRKDAYERLEAVGSWKILVETINERSDTNTSEISVDDRVFEAKP